MGKPFMMMVPLALCSAGPALAQSGLRLSDWPDTGLESQTVPLFEIMSGGSPPIDESVFVRAKEDRYLSEREPVATLIFKSARLQMRVGPVCEI